jgi:hypothetical protein
MADKKFQPIKHFEELYPSSAVAIPRIRPISLPETSPRKIITPEYPSHPPKELQPPKPRQSLPKIIIFQPTFKELDQKTAKEFIYHQQFTGLDSFSIRQLIFRHPRIFLAALSQTILNLVLFPYRAGWSALIQSERNRYPWLSTALEWGFTAKDFYVNAHSLPDGHPLKHLCLTNARQLEEWEHQHKLVAWYFRDSKPLDRLLSLPVPIGSDCWPVNQLDHQGIPLPAEQLYSQTALFFTYPQPKISDSIRNLIRKTALDALKKGRLSLVQQ